MVRTIYYAWEEELFKKHPEWHMPFMPILYQALYMRYFCFMHLSKKKHEKTCVNFDKPAKICIKHLMQYFES